MLVISISYTEGVMVSNKRLEHKAKTSTDAKNVKLRFSIISIVNLGFVNLSPTFKD